MPLRTWNPLLLGAIPQKWWSSVSYSSVAVVRTIPSVAGRLDTTATSRASASVVNHPHRLQLLRPLWVLATSSFAYPPAFDRSHSAERGIGGAVGEGVVLITVLGGGGGGTRLLLPFQSGASVCRHTSNGNKDIAETLNHAGKLRQQLTPRGAGDTGRQMASKFSTKVCCIAAGSLYRRVSIVDCRCQVLTSGIYHDIRNSSSSRPSQATPSYSRRQYESYITLARTWALVS